MVYFYAVQDFEAWFKTSSRIRWAILANSDTGEVVSNLECPTPSVSGNEPLPEPKDC